jgi:hypothetical protein
MMLAPLRGIRNRMGCVVKSWLREPPLPREGGPIKETPRLQRLVDFALGQTLGQV